MTEQTNPRVTEAARWLATTPTDQKPHPIIPALRRRFGLTMLEATLAAAESVLIQARAN
ncbi:hypothetical protein HGG72_05535 [Ochrobactrum pecoris]|uniref:Uncharacterized protein n=1 Tax=Brucella pecoris TaxID=867683 RepID=A0AB34YWD3_9HYPH|nr:hypothetical protein [Brucella pecoris]MBB4094088.1 hypothetical protein [Brucella pecoris]NKW79900.1 hypothetical protein [Brucella pecoris]